MICYLLKVLNNEHYQKICDEILKISPYIRFVGAINEDGDLMRYARRKDLVPLLDAKNTKYQFSHISLRTDMESYFDKSLGTIDFVWEERKKVQTISFAINTDRIWVSIDKDVIRSEVLRIIDACMPIVQKHGKAIHTANNEHNQSQS